MNTYARVVDGVVAEVFSPPDRVAITDCFHADVAALFAPMPAGQQVEPNWTYANGVFAPPAAGTP